MIKTNNAAQAASISSFRHTGASRYPADIRVLSIAYRAAFPVSPVAQHTPYIYNPASKVAHTAQTRNIQNKLVCATLYLITSFTYVWWHIRHIQKSTYCMRARARAVNRYSLLDLYSNYLKIVCSYCALPVLTLVCVCSFRMFLSVPCVPKIFEVSL